jgi:hypothetical protein
LLLLVIFVSDGNSIGIVQYAYAGGFGFRGFEVNIDLEHNGIGTATLCLDSENQDALCERIDLRNEASPVERRHQYARGEVSIGDELEACVTNIDTGVSRCRTTVINDGGPENFDLTFPESQTSPPILLFFVIIIIIVIILIIVAVLRKLRRKTRPEDNIDFE